MSKSQQKPETKQLMVFNAIWAVIFLVIGLLPLARGRDMRIWAVVISALFTFAALLLPQATSGFYRVWVKFGTVVGHVNSSIILSLLFFLIITPVAIVMKLLRRDILSKRLEKGAKTYFKTRDIQPETMKNQY